MVNILETINWLSIYQTAIINCTCIFSDNEEIAAIIIFIWLTLVQLQVRPNMIRSFQSNVYKLKLNQTDQKPKNKNSKWKKQKNTICM